jgi:threonine/homoserine/homoserine lactone efflux protein
VLENALALVLATIVLILIPGPNVALIVANSLRHGLSAGLVTAAGTTVGIGVQLLLVVAGMAALIDVAASALLWIKWLGVAYLVYLGIRTWNEPAEDLAQIGPQTTAGAFWRGFGFAVINPKTLLFNAAFLPQFVDESARAGSQLFVLAAIFLVVIVVGDALWALFAATARGWLRGFGRLRNRITGGFLFGAGVGLALTRRAL